MSFLQLQGVEKTYPDGTRAVKGVDLAIDEGEFIVLLGPSGCGKTTTLRMIAGLEIATAGMIAFAGKDATRLRPSQRDIGFVFQFYALYPNMSVRENLLFPLRAVGMAKAEREQRLLDISARLGLTDLLSRRPRQLSGGDQQRVSLGRAMIRTPQAYLMDEPLGTLDADRRQEMAEYIRAQQLATKVTTIYVTHDQEEAMSLADRIVVMKDGLIQQVGDPATVYADPSNLFVANFIGSPGMNQLAGCVQNGQLQAAAEAQPLHMDVQSGIADGTELTIGIRPEFVQVADAAGDRAAGSLLNGTVMLDEYQGSFRSVHVETPFGPVCVRCAPDVAYPVGAPIQLRLPWEHVRLFSTTTGERLA